MTPDHDSPTRTSPPSVSDPTTLQAAGPVFAGRYHVVRPLGEGGMGAVYLARDAELARDVAVKVLPGERAGNPDSVARFRREATALAKLSHPGIVQAFDVGEHAGRPFLVMEYVPGENLADRLKRTGNLTPSRAADVGHQVALALAYAHAQGLIHRDVKPGNIILTPEGRAKVLDLGLARFLQDQVGDPSRTREGTGMGTPDYSSPEQFRDAHSADPRSDLYALGCTLYHLIGGRVPFPGSSLSEKLDAHERSEPTPLEELAPDAPVGLALAVRKMMAKKPRDRFPSARAAADALAPYVAGGASTVNVFRQTAVWDGSQLRGTPRRTASRLGSVVLGVAAGLVAAVLAVGAASRAGWLQVGRPETARAEPPGPPAGLGPVTPAREVAPPPRPADVIPDEPGVLTVSQKPEGGGKYRTINAALADVKPGNTVRVLDDAVYRERVLLNRSATHAGVTLEAPRGAVLEADREGGVVVILNTPSVTVRGFRLRAARTPRVTLIGAVGRCPGVRLEDLVLESDGSPSNNGVELAPGTSADDHPPVTVQGCRFHQLAIGVGLIGPPPQGSERLVVRGCSFTDSMIGVKMFGRLRRAQVVGNRFQGMEMAGVQLDSLDANTEDLLIANNTFADCGSGLRIWDLTVRGKNVRVRNNLSLGASRGDFAFYLGDPAGMMPKGAGDVAAVGRQYQWGFNHREGAKPDGEQGKVWIPPGPKDVVAEKLAGLDRDPKSPHYLRPAKDSPLATGGAGTEDPTLPTYVGAVPPEGTDPWDWDRTFRMPADAQLLTVSKDPKAGGKYQTITAALKDAKPWATVRVLDGATYEETITLDDPVRHTGVSLEAAKRATLTFPPGATRLVAIRGVPHVRLDGLRMRGEKVTQGSTCVTVSGAFTGVELANLDIRIPVPVLTIVLSGRAGGGEPPLVVRRCVIDTPGEGIIVSGPPETRDGIPHGGVLVRDNRVNNIGYRPVVLIGHLNRVLVAGNVIVRGSVSGLQTEDLPRGSGRLVFANNTSHESGFGFRYWLNNPPKSAVPAGQAELVGNLLIDSTNTDFGCVQASHSGMSPIPDFARELNTNWRFRRNVRDGAGGQAQFTVPAAPDDIVLNVVPLDSKDPGHPGYLRPTKGSALATRGPGAEDAALPTYIGAIPPESVEPWDWSRTWRWKMTDPPPAGTTKPAEKQP